MLDAFLNAPFKFVLSRNKTLPSVTGGNVFTSARPQGGGGVHPLGQTPPNQTPPRQTLPWANRPPEMVTAEDGTHPTGMHSF